MSVEAPRDDTDGGDMTLAFSLSAVERLADPNAAFDDAGRWSRYVGVIDNDTDAVESFVRERDLRQDFELGDRDIWLSTTGVLEATDTGRHVFVGTSPEDRRVATHVGWEFVHVTEAAEKAGWDLEGDRTNGGNGDSRSLLERVRDFLSSGSPSQFRRR